MKYEITLSKHREGEFQILYSDTIEGKSLDEVLSKIPLMTFRLMNLEEEEKLNEQLDKLSLQRVDDDIPF